MEYIYADYQLWRMTCPCQITRAAKSFRTSWPQWGRAVRPKAWLHTESYRFKDSRHLHYFDLNPVKVKTTLSILHKSFRADVIGYVNRACGLMWWWRAQNIGVGVISLRQRVSGWGMAWHWCQDWIKGQDLRLNLGITCIKTFPIIQSKAQSHV